MARMASPEGDSDKVNKMASQRVKANPAIGTRLQIAEDEFRSNIEYGPRDVPYSQQPSDARIMAQLEFMADQLAKAYALLRELEDRLDPILIPDLGQGEDPEAPMKASSLVSNIIDQHNGRISELQSKIIQILGRVQL